MIMLSSPLLALLLVRSCPVDELHIARRRPCAHSGLSNVSSCSGQGTSHSTCYFSSSSVYQRWVPQSQAWRVTMLGQVGDASRGYLLELLLTKLRYATDAVEPEDVAAGEGVQIIGMSATMPNASAVAGWLGAALYTTDFRPVPLAKYIKVSCLVGVARPACSFSTHAQRKHGGRVAGRCAVHN